MGFLPVYINFTRKQWFVSQRDCNFLGIFLYFKKIGWEMTDNFIVYDSHYVDDDVAPIWEEEWDLKKEFAEFKKLKDYDDNIIGEELINETKNRFNNR